MKEITERRRSLVYNVGTNDMPPGWQAKVAVLSQFTEEQRQEMAVQNALVDDALDRLLASDGGTLTPEHAEIAAMLGGCGDETIDCPFYPTWKGMVQSCYDPYWLNDNQDDRDATVCDEWKSFSTFKEWMETQDWGEGKVLGFREPTSMIA